jgi:hypothetical protein
MEAADLVSEAMGEAHDDAPARLGPTVVLHGTASRDAKRERRGVGTADYGRRSIGPR